MGLFWSTCSVLCVAVFLKECQLVTSDCVATVFVALGSLWMLEHSSRLSNMAWNVVQWCAVYLFVHYPMASVSLLLYWVVLKMKGACKTFAQSNFPASASTNDVHPTPPRHPTDIPRALFAGYLKYAPLLTTAAQTLKEMVFEVPPPPA
jgi:hypothetical protein